MEKSSQNITLFKSITDIDTPFYLSVDEVLERIRSGKSKDTVKLVREETDKRERNELKKRLPSICFSGRFTKRADAAIIEHSGFICLDFDGYAKSSDRINAKEALIKNRYVHSVFDSPSGNGLKVLVRIPNDAENHVKYFNALEKHFQDKHFDTTSKNISRVCYESYDPLIYINKNSSLWDTMEEPEYKEYTKGARPTIPITDENKVVDILIKWWEKKYPMVEGQRNQNCYILAMAFNDYGINESLASHVLNGYASSDFLLSEIKATIKSAYSNRAKHGTKYYEDHDRVNDIKSQLRRGTPKKQIKEHLQEEAIDDDVIDSVINMVEEEEAKQKFWTKNDKGIVKLMQLQFKEFLEDNGYHKFCPEGSKNYVFVKVTSNLVDHADEKEIKDFVLDYLLGIEDVSVYNYFADNTRFFKEEYLSMLSTVDIHFISDTKDAAYLYYLNCAVRVTKDSIDAFDYTDLAGYVWKDHVIDRNFNSCSVSEEFDYKKFISNICAGDESRISSMESTIGFMMHGHKNLSYCPAVILNDEVISDNPEGGTGKGLFMNALSQIKKVVTIDGKSFNFERSFAYQLVSADTQILVFDDVRKHFEFERLFSIVTEGITLEKKNKDAIKIPFYKSPKIAITTNYAIKGAGNSFERRKWELELHSYYKKDFTPLDEFGKLMFGDWNDDDWCEFDNYMLGCLQSYLNTSLVKSKFVNLKIRKLSAETTHDFIEWCGLIDGSDKASVLHLEGKIYTNDCYNDFIQEYPDYGSRSKFSVSRIKFNRWLYAYAKFISGVEPKKGKDATGKYFIIDMRKSTEGQMDVEF